ncbi:Amino acid permease/ SLC12A domain-containing protein [Plasmodiophora brassicae]
MAIQSGTKNAPALEHASASNTISSVVVDNGGAPDKTAGAAPKTVGLVDGIVFVLSCTVGSGLFFAPGVSAHALGDPCASLLSWLAAGVLSLAGAWCYAELGTTFVSAGAESHYFKKAFGPATSFCFTWSTFLIAGSSACCAIAIVMGQYVIAIFTDATSPLSTQFIATGVLAFLAIVNMINPSYVLMLNRFNVVCKVLAVAIVIVGAIIAAAMGATPANAFMGQSCFGPQTEWASFGKGMVFALFAFSGWNYLNPLTAEMKDPQRDVPRVYTIGMLTTITLALGVNVAFFVVLPFDQLTNKLAGPFAEVVDPASGILKPILCLMISFCCLGSCNGIMMGSSRIIAAAGENGDIPACFSWKTKRHGTPYVALIAFAVYTSVMAFAMNLDDTVDFYTVGQWTFFVLIGISIYVLRRKFPDVRRPFKVIGYPVVPAVFVAVSAYAVGVTFVPGGSEVPVVALVGVAIMAAGFGVYYVRRMHRPAKVADDASTAGDKVQVELATPAAAVEG